MSDDALDVLHFSENSVDWWDLLFQRLLAEYREALADGETAPQCAPALGVHVRCGHE